MIEKKRLPPLFLALVIIVIDQVSKALIVNSIDLNSLGYSFFDGYFNIIHVRNLGILFSFGHQVHPIIRSVVFSFLPLAVLVMLALNILLTPSQWGKLVANIKQENPLEEFTLSQRWALGAIIGGGVGNVIDRIFRPLGVVDFIDLSFFGLFGLDRWPTFNVADSAVTCGVAILLVTMIVHRFRRA